MNNLLDIYRDYLISSFSQTTATGLSRLLEGEISHDKVTRLLSQSRFSSSYQWSLVKSTIRDIEKDDGVLIFDDTIQEKPHTDENEIVTWHFDHTKGRTVKGINLLILHTGIICAFEKTCQVFKTWQVLNRKTQFMTVQSITAFIIIQRLRYRLRLKS